MGKADEEAKKIKKSVESTKETMDELVFATRDFAVEAGKAAKSVFENSIQASETRKSFKDLASSATEIAQNIDNINDGTKSIADISKTQVKFEDRKKKLAVEQRQALGKILKSNNDIEAVMKGQLTSRQAAIKSGKAFSSQELILLDIYDEQNEALKDTEKEMGDLAKRAKQIESGMGAVGKVTGRLSKIFPKLGLDEAVNKGRELSASLTDGQEGAAGFGTKMKVAGTIIGSVGKSLTAAFGPIALIGMALKEIIAATKKVDATAGDLAKNLGTSHSEALALGGDFRDMADNFGDVLVQGEDIASAQAQLNKHFGTTVKFSGKLSAEMASVQKRTKLSEGSMNFFSKLSLKTGKTITKTLKDITKTTLEQNKQKKLMMSAKQVQEAIGKTSSLIKINNKDNVQELAKAVMATKALGISMEKLDAIGGSLLDFESSIAAEMEAEMLIGKDINLEKARAAALANDEVALAESLAEQVGTAAEFGSMNRIQQEAIAKAIGMSRTEMADMLYEQENLNTLQSAFGDQVNNINDAQAIYNERRAAGMSMEEASAGLADEQLTKQLESASEQEKFNGLIREVQEGFANIGQQVLTVFKGIKDAVGGGKNLLKIVKGIAAAYLVIKGTMMAAKALQAGQLAFETTKSAIMGTQAVAATTANAMTTFGLGTVIAVAAVATALGALAGYGLSSMSDGMIGPDGGMIVSGPKGSIQLDKQDSIIAGTDLMGGKSEGGGGGNNPQQIALLSEQNNLLRTLINKTSVIEMNGSEVGAEVIQSERAIQ